MTEINQQMALGASSLLAKPNATSKKSNNIQMDDFLKILSASMSNPPLGGDSGSSGSNGTDYISQLVQFTTLEQLQSLGENLEHTMMMSQQQQAIGMIGKEVTLSDSKGLVTGTVEKVKFANGFATIEVNGKDYLMSNIMEIGAK